METKYATSLQKACAGKESIKRRPQELKHLLPYSVSLHTKLREMTPSF